MSEAKELRTKLDQDLKALQERCPHLNSQWVVECWAIAHSTGYDIRVCINCEKVLERRCGQILEELRQKYPVEVVPYKELKPLTTRDSENYPNPPSQPEVYEGAVDDKPAGEEGA
jgi:hypothetical protein